MKADTVDLAAIFGKHVRYMVPLFQRPYVWTREKHWEPLWEDVRAVADRQLDDRPDNDNIPHFLGAVVLEQALVQVGMVDTRSVIDGQQRLTTLQLLVAAAKSVSEDHELADARQAFEALLANQDYLVRQDGYQLKLLPTERDREAFKAVMEFGLGSKHRGHPLDEAYRFFREAILEWINDEPGADEVARRIEALSNALWRRLLLVTIDLEPRDNAQVIFETLNARGTPLLAGDLIKNHLFQTATLQGADIDRLYREQWRTLDSDWWRKETIQGRLRRPRLDAYLTHWLTMRSGQEVISHDLFPAFKRYLAAGSRSAEGVLLDLERYARVYESWDAEPETTRLGRFLYRLGVMEVTTAYPALLWILGPEGLTDPVERQVAIDAIESWLVRRVLTRGTTKNYNNVFLGLLKAVRPADGEPPAIGRHVVDYLAGLSGDSQAWPDDEAVLTSLSGLPAYRVLTRSRLRMVLESLEQAMRTDEVEQVPLPHDLTIEHVMPQEWTEHWPLPPTEDPLLTASSREAIKHTIGNLTLLTGKLNSGQSNGPWAAKREAIRKKSVLLISADVRDAEAWDEAAIAARTDRLARLAISTWRHADRVTTPTKATPTPAPHAAIDTVDGIRPATTSPSDASARSETDHPQKADEVPDEVRRVIHMRASPAAERLTLRFAAEALGTDGVYLRAQKSKGDPWYFQVRHDTIKQVVAYVHPVQSGLKIDYRLPQDHETYGQARSKDSFYGITMLLGVDSDVDVALRLLGDALERTDYGSS